MLTGRLAFPGDTISDTIAKILEREPDWSLLPEPTPGSVRRLLRHCLAKDPKQRLRDIGDVRLGMDASDDGSPGVADEAVPRPAGAPTRLSRLPWVALAVFVTAVGVWEARRSPIIQETPLANAQFSRFTDWEGTEAGAEISPDGRFVAFHSGPRRPGRSVGQPGGHRPFSQPDPGPSAAELGRNSEDLRLYRRRCRDLVH